MQSKYTTKEIIEKYTNKNGHFAWGVETVIDSLTHNVEYNLNAKDGLYLLTKWDLQEPSSKEIKEEYIRQQTISECLEYFKEKNFFYRLKKFLRITY